MFFSLQLNPMIAKTVFLLTSRTRGPSYTVHPQITTPAMDVCLTVNIDAVFEGKSCHFKKKKLFTSLWKEEHKTEEQMEKEQTN